MDIAGIGDSSTRPGRPVDDVFPVSALSDIEAGIAYLRGHCNVREVTLAGLCSGAYHALRAAAAGLPVDRIIMVNPQNYFWTQGSSMQDLQIAEVVRNPRVYRERIGDLSAWKRLLLGKVNVWRIAHIYVVRQFLVLESALRNVARVLSFRLPNDLGRELEEIAARGIAMTFVFAAGEPGIGLLNMQGGSSLKTLGERCRLRIIERGDHTFSQSAARLVMEDILSEELYLGPSPEVSKAAATVVCRATVTVGQIPPAAPAGLGLQPKNSQNNEI
jgi:pimeloyl-ACP methyl ester carboxylesterase